MLKSALAHSKWRQGGLVNGCVCAGGAESFVSLHIAVCPSGSEAGGDRMCSLAIECVLLR